MSESGQVQDAVRDAATRIDDALATPHKTIGGSILVDVSDLRLVMDALASSWPQRETVMDLTAKVQYLLDGHAHYETDSYTFPDGDVWLVKPHKSPTLSKIIEEHRQQKRF